MIHYFIQFIIINFFILLPFCYAMEAPTFLTSSIFCQIPVPSAQSVQCLRHHIVALIKKNCCSLYDYSKNPAINIYNYSKNNVYAIAHPKKELILIGSKEYDKEYLSLYNIITQKTIWEKQLFLLFDSPFFSQTDDTIFITVENSKKMYELNFLNGTCKEYLLPFGHTATTKLLTTNPIKPELAVYSYLSRNIRILQIDNKCGSVSIKKTVQSICFENKKITDGHYSSDGSTFIANDPDTGLFVADANLKSNSYDRLINFKEKNTQLYAMTFHPTSPILVLLTFPLKTQGTQIKAYIEYWNIKTKKIIAKTPLLLQHKPQIKTHFFNYNRMDFSYDGTKIFITLEDNCIGLDVPLKALFQSKIKEKYILTYIFLRQYLHDNKQLPLDIQKLLLYNLLKVHKYSFTNY